MEALWDGIKSMWPPAVWCQLRPKTQGCQRAAEIGRQPVPGMEANVTSSLYTTASSSPVATTERPTNRLPCVPSEAKQTKCLNGGKCFAVVIKDQRHVACHCPEGFTGRRCEEKVIVHFLRRRRREVHSPRVVAKAGIPQQRGGRPAVGSAPLSSSSSSLSVSITDGELYSASLLLGVLAVVGFIVLLLVIGFFIWHKFFRDSTSVHRSAPPSDYYSQTLQRDVKLSTLANEDNEGVLLHHELTLPDGSLPDRYEKVVGSKSITTTNNNNNSRDYDGEGNGRPPGYYNGRTAQV